MSSFHSTGDVCFSEVASFMRRTRLDQFFAAHGLSASQVARTARYSRSQLYLARVVATYGSTRFRSAVLRAVRAELRKRGRERDLALAKSVTLDDLFDAAA